MLTTHLHLVPKLRMTGSIPPLPHVPSWHAEELFYLYPYLTAFFKLFQC